MANKIIIGLAALLAIVMGFAPDIDSGGMLSLGLVVLGLVYAGLAVDAEDAGGYLILTLAVGAAAGADALSHIPTLGGYLDAIIDNVSTVLTAGVATVIAVWIVNRVKG